MIKNPVQWIVQIGVLSVFVSFQAPLLLAGECSSGDPISKFTVEPTRYDAPAEVHLNGAESTGCDSDIVQADWDFGDGTSLSQYIPPDSITVDHTFPAGNFTIQLTVWDANGQAHTSQQELTIFDEFCELYPLTLSEDLFIAAPSGTVFEEVPTGVETGNYSWLTWSGEPSAVTLSNSLIPPGNSNLYVSPDDPLDTLIEIGDWAQGSPGVTNSRAVRDRLTDLIGVPIQVPLYSATRENGNLFDYLVADFAVIRLQAFELKGHGWVSFVFDGFGRCYNEPPVAEDTSVTTPEDTSVDILLPATDADEDPLVYTVIDAPTHGVLAGSGATVTYTPNPDFNGEDAFTFQVYDGEEYSEIATATISVTPVNDPPIAFNQQLLIDEDTSLPITLTGQDIDGDALIFTVVSGPSNGSLTGDAPNLVYLPDENFNGDDEFTFIVNDGELDSPLATVLITSNPVNDPPIAQDQSVVTEEDEDVSIVLEGVDIDGDALVYTLLSQPQNGVLSGDAPNLTYTPNAGYFGTDSFTFSVSDGFLDSNIAIVDITINEKNLPPVIVSPAATEAAQANIYNYPVSAVDPNTIDTLSFSLISAPAEMTVDPNTGLIEWQPDDALVNSLENTNAFCSVPLIDEIPRAADVVVVIDHSGSMNTEHQWTKDLVPALDAGLLINDVGVSGDPNRYGLVSYERNPNPIPVGGGLMGSPSEFLIAANSLPLGGGTEDGYKAAAHVLNNYPLRDGAAKNIILVTDEDRDNTNSALTFNSMRDLFIASNATLNVVVNASFRCPDGNAALGIDANSVGYLADGSGGYLTCDDAIVVSGAGNTVRDYIDLALSIGGAAWNLNFLRNGGLLAESFSAAIVQIKVKEIIEQLSILQADLIISNIGVDPENENLVWVTAMNRGLADVEQAVTVSLFEGLAPDLILAGEQTIGALEAGAATRLTFDLGQAARNLDFLSARIDQLGSELECINNNNNYAVPVVVVQVTDAGGLSDDQVFTVNVTESNEPPEVLTDPIVDAFVDSEYQYLAIASDPDQGDSWRFRLLNHPAGMRINPQTGKVTWEPEAADVGDHPVSISVTDITGASVTQDFILTVHLGNQPPLITSLPLLSVLEGETFSYQVTATDPDDDSLYYVLSEAPAGAAIDSAGLLTWPTGTGDAGEHVFLVRVEDGKGGVAPQSFILEVELPVSNTNPEIISAPPLNATVDQLYEYPVHATDADGDPLTYELVSAPGGMSIDSVSGLVTWIPGVEHTGSHVITIRVSDGLGGLATQSYSVIVVTTVSENRPPAITSQPSFTASVGLVYSYLVLAEDPDGDPLEFLLTISPPGMTIDGAGQISWTPVAGQAGVHPVEVRVGDGRGAYAIQQYDIGVDTTVENQPPMILSSPPVIATVDSAYVYLMDASDPENEALDFSLELAPTGMLISETGLVSWTPQIDQVGLHEVIIRVADPSGGVASQLYSIIVLSSVDNRPPAIISSPVISAKADFEYSYQMIAVDPDSDALTFSIINAPAGLAVSPSGLVTWLPAVGDIGSHSVVLRVSDGRGGLAEQSYNIVVSDGTGNQAPVMQSVPPLTARATFEYQYAIVATDEDADVLSYLLVQGPDGMTVDTQSGLLVWTPTAEGNASVTIEVSDGAMAIIQSWNIEVLSADTALSVSITIAPDMPQPGDEVLVSVQALAAIGAVSKSATIDGEPLILDGNGQAIVIAGTIGEHLVSATVSDAFDTAQGSKSFFVRDPSDTLAPTVTLDNIDFDQEITAPHEVIGTVQDTALASWILAVKDKGPYDDGYTVLATGNDTFSHLALATFDPTLLMNGQYQIILQATDQNGNTAFDSRTVRVTGDLKVGNFSITFEDLLIPVSGIPITVNRTYDSRRRSEDLDFGYGWSIDYQNVEINESRTPGLGWEITETRSGPFGAFYEFCVKPAGDPIVTVTLPDGSVEEFEAYASPECNAFIPIIDVQMKFRSVDGSTLSTLEQTDLITLRLINGNLSDIEEVNIPADPNHYRLTTQAGYVYQLDQAFGIRTVDDPNGNTLTYTDDGIFHSDGKSVLFNRDGLGRITEIVDPNNNIRTYEYDAFGDLIAAADEVNATVTHTYNLNHGLLEIFDPLGRRIVRNIYDDDNRLIAQEDNAGNRTEFNHDIAGRQSVITDRLGRVTIFGYDDEGNVLTQVDPAGGIASFTYDADGNQLTQTNPLGHTTTATYNSRRDQLTQTDALGNTVSFTYNQFGQETTVTDARGNQYDNTYDPFGNLLVVEDPLGNIAGQNINAKGLVSLRRDAELNETTFSYDDDGNVLTETDPLANVTTNTWDANGNKLSESRQRTLADGSEVTETTTFEYDERSRLVRTTDPLGNETETEYDLLGRETARIDVLLRRTEMEYDVFGRLTRTTYPDASTETRTYDKEGNLLTETDRLGRATKHIYDLLDREVETIFPDATPGDDSDNSRNFTEYDAAGRVTANIDANGNRTEYGYDDAGRRTSTNDALGHVTTFTYDADGNLLSTTDARGHTTTHTYDALNRRMLTTFEDNSTKATEYDALERVTAEIDQNGIRTEYAYDALGRLLTVTDALGNDTAFSYDEVGNKLDQTDAEGRTTQWEYDALGRSTAHILPLGQVAVMSYDTVGNRSGMVDFNGNATTYTYDAMDRLTRADYFDGSFETHSYNDEGQRTASSHRYGSENWAYDERGRLLGHTDIHGVTVSYNYDAVGNRISVTSPANTVSYTFDSLNRMKTISDGSSYQYDQVGNTSKVVFANGTETAYTYDALNRLTDVQHLESATGIVFDQQSYDLLPSGHRISITEFSGRVVDYIYDDLYRLTEERSTDAVIGNRVTVFGFDKVGNRLSRDDGGVITTYVYDDNDRMLSETTAGVTTTYSYDDQGNNLSKDVGGSVTTYAYDPNQRMIGADDGANPITLEYDASGIRQSRSDSASTVTYIIDANRDYAQVIEEQGASAVTYTYGLDLLSQQRSGSTSYYHYDGLGSTRSLSDAGGNVTDSYVYKAFGTLEAQNGLTDNDYLFAGEQFDDGLAQYYLRARYYDPAQGRFTQMDTFAGLSRDPVTLHKYLYAGATPVNMVDPSGNFYFGLTMSNAWTITLTLSRSAVGRSVLRQGLKTAFKRQLQLAAKNKKLIASVAGAAVLTTFANIAYKRGEDNFAGIPILSHGSELPKHSEHIWDAIRGHGSNESLSPWFLNRAPRVLGAWYNKYWPCKERPAYRTVCDEYPFASTSQGGEAKYLEGSVSLRLLPISEMSTQGNLIKKFYDVVHISPDGASPQSQFISVALPAIPSFFTDREGNVHKY